MKRGIVVEFAESGLAWLTPERVDRVERALERLADGSENGSLTKSLAPAGSKADLLKLSLFLNQRFKGGYQILTSTFNSLFRAGGSVQVVFIFLVG